MVTRSRGLTAVIFALLLVVVGSTTFVVAQGGDAENGKGLFSEYCAVCHGYDGQGRVGAGLGGWFAGINPEAFVRSTVSDGVANTMPAFSQSKGGRSPIRKSTTSPPLSCRGRTEWNQPPLRPQYPSHLSPPSPA